MNKRLYAMCVVDAIFLGLLDIEIRSVFTIYKFREFDSRFTAILSYYNYQKHNFTQKQFYWNVDQAVPY